MSTSSGKVSVVWLELEKKSKTVSKTSNPPVSLFSPVSERPLVTSSPSPWIDLRSIASSDDKSEIETESVHSTHTRSTTSASSLSIYTPSEGWEMAAGYEKAGLPWYYEDMRRFSNHESKRFSMASKKRQSVASIGSNIIYPSNFRLFLIIISLSLSTLLVALDRTVVATAIPQITDQFQRFSDASWYGAVYLLTATSLQPTWGKVYQIFNVKGVYVFVMTIFTIGSLVSATAPNSPTFIFGRALAGLGSGGSFSGGLTIIAYSVPLERRALINGFLGAFFGVAMFAGPVIGGVFTDNLSWRWCFYINLPVCAISIVGILLCLQNPEALKSNKTFRERLKELDFIGPCIFIPAMVSLLLALQFGGSQFSWGSGVVIGLICCFIVLIPTWIYSQFRLGDKATVPVRLMTQRTVFFSCMFSFFSSAAFIILTFYVPLYFQAVRETDATKSGVATLPLVLSSTISSIIGGILVTIVGYYTPVMILGMTAFTVSIGLISTIGVTTSLPKLVGLLIFAGVGMGMNMQTPIIAVQTVVQLRDIPVATALTLFAQQLGASLFLAVAQTILLNKLIPQIQAINSNISEGDIIRAGATGLTKLLQGEQLVIAINAYANSLDAAFILAAATAAISVIWACGVEWKSLKSPREDTKEGELERN